MELSKNFALKHSVNKLESDIRTTEKVLLEHQCTLKTVFIDIDRNKLDPMTIAHIINDLNKCNQALASMKGLAETMVNEITPRLDKLGDKSADRKGFEATTDTIYVTSPVDDVIGGNEDEISLTKTEPVTGDDAMSRLQPGDYQREPHGRNQVRGSSDSGIVSTSSTLSIPSLNEQQTTDNPDESGPFRRDREHHVTEGRRIDDLNRLNPEDGEESIEDNTRVGLSNVPRDSVAFAQGFEPDDQDFLKLQGKMTNKHRVQKGHRRCKSDSKISRDSSLDQ